MFIKDIQAITSKDNRYLKEFRSLQQKKHRLETGLFPVEGLRLAEEALKSGWQVAYALFSQDISENQRGFELLEAISGRNIPLFKVSDKKLLNYASDTENSQGIALIVKAPARAYVAKEDLGDLVLIADAVADPGNLGTLFRTALASGVSALITTKGSVDCYNPKLVRSTMGAIFKLPFSEGLDNPEILSMVKRAGLPILAASSEGRTVYTKANLKQPFALVIGAEAQGIGSFWSKAVDESISLPMLGGVESLNVSVASGILLYEAMRQRILS